MEYKLKHLEFIQTVIGRQATNSFLLKGWVITIITALFTFSPQGETLKRILAVYALIFIFWLLDIYYLQQERLFRALFEHVRTLNIKNIDFTMNSRCIKNKKDCSWLDVAISKTLLLFYIPLMLFTIIFFYLR